MTASRYHFDRCKPFYPLVMNYICQLIGMKELILRGMVGPRRIEEMLAIAVAREPRSDPMQLRKQLEELAGPLGLRSERLDDNVEVPIDEFAQELIANHIYLLPHFARAAGTVLMSAHEISKNKAWHNQDAIWEFLRHCRHSVAHNGMFHFVGGEPRRRAAWGPFLLTAALHATPLFKKDRTESGMLSLGDPIRLLYEIEQAYPAMIAD